MVKEISLGDNIKGVRLDDLPPEAWTTVVGETQDSDLVDLYGRVAWLWRGTQLRANGVASMPFEVRRGQAVVYDSVQDENPPDGLEWLRRLPTYNAKIEAAATLRGAAYFEARRNLRGRDLGFDWMLPDSIKPVIHRTEGLTGFERQVGGRTVTLDTEEVIYFWLPDWRVELGPAKDYPGKAALAAAGVLRGAAEFLAGYFDRGLIKATLLTYEDAISSEEASRVKTWWRRVFSGSKNAHASEVVRGDFKPIVIGEGLQDLTNNNLTTEQREDISAALGVPQSKLFKKPGGLGDAQDSDNRTFYDDTIIPEVNWISDVWNEQVFEPAGLSLVYTPQKMSIYQEDEEQRSQSFVNYVKGGVPTETALAILGVTVPEGMAISAMMDDGGETIPQTEQTGITEKQVLNGAQITSAIGIIEGFAAGLYPRDSAVNMMTSFFNMPRDAVEGIIPTVAGQIDTTAKRAELASLRRYVKRGKHEERPFKLEALTPAEVPGELREAVAVDAPFCWESY